MRILEVLQKDAIIADLKSQDKKGALEELVEPAARISGVKQEELVRILLDRERLGSTGIGSGIGIPHGKFKGIDSLVLVFGLSRKGLDFDSIDNRPTHIFFMLITPENSTGLHLKILARISSLLKDNRFKNDLINAADRDEIYSVIENVDEDF